MEVTEDKPEDEVVVKEIAEEMRPEEVLQLAKGWTLGRK